MSIKRTADVKGIIVAILLFAATAAVSYRFFEAKTCYIICAVEAVLSVIVLIIRRYNLNHDANKEAKKQRAAERKKATAFLSKQEVIPPIIKIPDTTDFSNDEELLINLDFRALLERRNAIILKKAHLEYLLGREAALRALDKDREASKIAQEAKKLQFELDDIMKDDSNCFKSEYNNTLSEDPEIVSAFSAFSRSLTNRKTELSSEFFRESYIKSVKLNVAEVLFFTYAYALHYDGNKKELDIIFYRDIDITSTIKTEMLTGEPQADDEYANVGYRHETKAGNRDRRFNEEKNHKYTFVYRGSVRLECPTLTCLCEFSNRSKALEFERALTAYTDLLRSKGYGYIRGGGSDKVIRE